MIEYDQLKKTIQNLEKIYQENKDSSINNYNETIQYSVRMAVIKGFELCYEALFKSLTRHLRDELSLTDVPVGPNRLIRRAFEAGLFSSSPEKWFEYIKIRNITTHEYGRKETEVIFENMDDFIDDAIGLYQTMSGKSWQ